MVKNIIEKTIRENNLINSGEHIVLGLSGGPDSVCLFSVLQELSIEMNFTLHAVHVNHGLRPGDADEDQKYVEQLCASKGISCSCFSYDCNAIAAAEGLSSEEAGRKMRYASFRKVAADIAREIREGESASAGEAAEDKVKIAVAQNADDQAETVLLRLVRGTGPDGLAGMNYSRMEENICVIRPLLDTWRRDIEEYCREKELHPRTDGTNLQPIYTRNKIRLQLIPYLEENFNSGIQEGLVRLSRIAGEDKDYLWQCAEEAYERLETSKGALDQKQLMQLHPSIRHRVIMKALQQQGLSQDVTSVHLEAADHVLEKSGESRTVEFPDGYRMTVRYGEAAFYRESDLQQEASLKITVSEKGDAGHGAAGVSHGDTDSSPAASGSAATAEFDYDKIKAVHGDAGVQLRTRREGDFLSITGGRKKIQNLFVDMKVPKEHRDSVLLAAVGSEILWLPAQPEKGVLRARYSQRYKLDADTKSGLQLELICEI